MIAINFVGGRRLSDCVWYVYRWVYIGNSHGSHENPTGMGYIALVPWNGKERGNGLVGIGGNANTFAIFHPEQANKPT